MEHRATYMPEQPDVLPLIEEGTLTLYRFYDVGSEIDLDRAQTCLAEPAMRRHTSREARQSSSIQVAQPPLHVELGPTSATLGGLALPGLVRAGIYDLGAVAVALELPLPPATDWAAVADLLANAQDPPPEMLEQFRRALDDLEAVIRPAITRPQRDVIVEDYSVLIVKQLAAEANVVALAEHPRVQSALLGEQRQVSADAVSLISSLSYYPDDLALLSWNGAILIEADPLAAMTAADLLEYANVQLLLLRTYDASLDADLPRMYQRMAGAQSRFSLPFVRRYTRLLHDVQRLVAEVVEVTERVDNAFKVTDDVYWNRLYSATLNVLRVEVWREGVDHKLALVRETYGMLHDQADAERANALEWAIVLLIVFEIVMALLGL